jgi:hypothetical protein
LAVELGDEGCVTSIGNISNVPLGPEDLRNSPDTEYEYQNRQQIEERNFLGSDFGQTGAHGAQEEIHNHIRKWSGQHPTHIYVQQGAENQEADQEKDYETCDWAGGSEIESVLVTSHGK